MQIAVEPFICLSDPVIYLATDDVGRIRPIGANAFQANLTNVQPGLIAATLTTTMRNENDNTTVQCSDVLTSSSLQRRNLTQSRKSKYIV